MEEGFIDICCKWIMRAMHSPQFGDTQKKTVQAAFPDPAKMRAFLVLRSLCLPLVSDDGPNYDGKPPCKDTSSGANLSEAYRRNGMSRCQDDK
jgi:hypothetical protein